MSGVYLPQDPTASPKLPSLIERTFYVSRLSSLDTADSLLRLRSYGWKRLFLHEVTLTKRRIATIAKFVDRNNISIENLSIHYCKFKQPQALLNLATWIRGQAALRKIIFGDNNLPLIFLVLALQGKSMETIHVNNRSLSGHRGEDFLKKLLTSVPTKELRVGNMFALDFMTIRGLCRGLESPSCVTETLHLVHAVLDYAAVAALVDTLGHHQASTIKTFSLWNNKLTASTLPLISRLIRENKSLEMLSLDCNKNLFFGADKDMADDFSSSIVSNKTLKSLSLWGTPLGDVVAIPLFNALETNASLAKLNFDVASVSIDGYRELIKSLPKFMGLRELCLDWRRIFHAIPEEMKNEIYTALRRNTSLTSMSCCHLFPDHDMYSLGAAVCERNKCLARARRITEIVDDGSLWKVALLDFARNEQGACAIFELLRHRPPPTRQASSLTIVPSDPPPNPVGETELYTMEPIPMKDFSSANEGPSDSAQIVMVEAETSSSPVENSLPK
jgi:hypothetical protein